MKKNKVFKIIAILAFVLAIVGIFVPKTASLICELIAATTLFVIGILSWIVPSKNSTILKLIILILLYLTFLSWVITATASQGGQLMNIGLYRVSLYELVYYPFVTLTMGQFTQILFFLLAIGGLYGILGHTGKYRNKLEKIAKSMKGKEEVFLAGTALILAIISSIFGLNLYLFIFIPALCGIIILMGYDKITAFLTTFASTLIGIIGSTYSGSILVYINNALGTDFKTELIAKIALFVISFIVYIAFTLKYAKKAKTKKVESEIENDEIPFLGEKKQSKKPSWPIFVIMGILLILLILGCTLWFDVFETSLFTDIHEAINEWTIKDHTILAYLINDMNQFGKWTYSEMTIMVALASIIISLIYNFKFDEAFKSFCDGAKKMLKPALLLIFAYTVVVITAWHPFLPTITDWMMNLISDVSGVFGDLLFILFSGINIILSTILNIDLPFVVQSTLQYITTESSNVLAIITQAFYGLTLFLAPTSSMLILGLEYLDIPYKEWLKTSWKLVLQLLAVIIVIILIVMFI